MIENKVTKKIHKEYFSYFEVIDLEHLLNSDLKPLIDKFMLCQEYIYLGELEEELKFALLSLNSDKDRYRYLNIIIDKFHSAGLDYILGYFSERIEKLSELDNIENFFDLSNSDAIDKIESFNINPQLLKAFGDVVYCLYKIKNFRKDIYKSIKNVFEYFNLDYNTFMSKKFEDLDELYDYYFINEIVRNKEHQNTSNLNAIPETEKTTIEKNKEIAKEFLLCLNGNNFLKQKIMSDKDFERLMEYTYYLIEYESLPKEINPLPHINISVEFIRKTYEQLHKRIYGKKKRQYWIDFLHEVFIQFESWDKETTNKNFATYRGQYEEDLKKLTS
ncbi:MAG: hypothetical protein WC223_09070 [Bacteroidales bacterium]|jgi:hypothetical protein